MELPLNGGEIREDIRVIEPRLFRIAVRGR